MSFLSNAHTHTSFCDGLCTPGEMLAAAKELGFVSLGFSGHADQGFDFAYSMGNGRQEEYRETLRELQAAQRGRGSMPRLWVGLEQDALVPDAWKLENRKRFNYILGSTHYLSTDFHGECVAADGDATLLKDYVEEVFHGDWMAMVQAYFEAHVGMLLSDKPDIIGHFDIVRKHGEGSGLFDGASPAYRRIARDALARAFACGGILEVNTGGMARGYLNEPYPSEELLRNWLDMGGKVTITSDCHDPKLLNYGIEPMMFFLKGLGYRSVMRLGAGDELWDEIAL